MISHQQRGTNHSIRDALTSSLSAVGKTFMSKFFRYSIERDVSSLEKTTEDFWALRDVSFEVKQGDRVGIIGLNGAGKSTLLKILSRITEPSEGRIGIKGRVASLLEVGTGFHPELTGRENIYLNGAILGMKRDEIRRRFDEIIDFAEIEKFLDTPVKRYSSGMYVRLAFAVAAHLEPEILIVDEVLAVGDVQFQKKCLGKMEEVGSEGRTVLFVSHNMGAIKRLCGRCLLLSEGRLTLDGTSNSVIGSYLTTGMIQSLSRKVWKEEEAPGDGSLRLISIQVANSLGEQTSELPIDKPFIIEIEINVTRELPEANLSILINNNEGVTVLHTSDAMGAESLLRKVGISKVRCEIPAYCMNVGRYSLDIASDVPFNRVIFYERNVLSWEILGTCEKMGRYGIGAWRGVLGPGLARWSQF